MKRKFSLISALIAGVMFIAMSCSNASNIIVRNEKPNGGLSTVTIALGDLPSYRSIYPNEIESAKSAFTYKLFGAVDAATKKNDMEKGIALNYADLSAGKAVVQLDPITWTSITLKAYSPDDSNNEILSATQSGVNLSEGNTTLTFNLIPVHGTVKGNVDISVVFYNNEVGKTAESVAIDIVKYNTPETSIIGEPIYIDKKDFTDKTSGRYAVQVSKKNFSQGLTSGKYYFKATFYDKDQAGVKKGIASDGNTSDDANIMLQYMTYLQIDGGNTSSATINIPKGAFNSKPDAPTNIATSTYFEPSATKLTIDESKKKYAQQSTSDSNDNKYKVVFTWTDNSFNEEGFELVFAATNGETYTVSKNISNGTKAAIKSSKTNVIGIDTVDQTGNMGPDCNSVTVSIPVGTFVESASVSAVNSFGNSAPNELNMNGSKVGIFTVTYDLFKKANGKVNLGGAAGITSEQYVVLPYEYGATDNLIAKDNVSHDNYTFASWSFVPSSPESQQAIEVTSVSEFGVDANTNVKVTANWLTPTTIKVTYPSYTAYKDLAVATGEGISEANKIVPEEGLDGAKKIKLTVPSEGADGKNVENVKFIIYNPDSKQDAKPLYTSTPNANEVGALDNSVTTTAMNTGLGAAIEWDIKEFLKTHKPAIYRLEISYDYTPGTGLMSVRKDGVFYVEVK